MTQEKYNQAKQLAMNILNECILDLDERLPEGEEDIQDRIRQVLDILTGWCHPDYLL